MARSVVLTMHPNAELVWRDRVPDAADAVHYHVSTGPHGWNRRMLPEEWDQAHASLMTALSAVLSHPGAHLHVVAAGPYALGLLLG